jgi:hypothetical protein
MSQIPLEQDEGAMGRPLAAGAILLSEKDLQQAAQQLDPAQSLEERWARFLRLLSLQALKRWLGERKSSVVVGPELNPEDPDRLLALNGLATQLLCVSPLADVVEVPLNHWRKTATAPQLLLLAQVDEDAGLVHFPGVLDARAFIAEVMGNRAGEMEVWQLPLKHFEGGLERLLRWGTLLDHAALPRAGIERVTEAGVGKELLSRLDSWLAEILVALPAPAILKVSGARSAVNGLRMITPVVEISANGQPSAMAVCSAPSLWAQEPLDEVQIWRSDELLWRKQGRLHEPIVGPIAWPLEPLQSGDKLSVRVRPCESPGGSSAEFHLSVDKAENINENDALIVEAISTIGWNKLARDEIISLAPLEIQIEILARIHVSNKIDYGKPV